MDRRRLYYLYFSATALFFTIGIGIIGFMTIEGYSFIEAFYMTMITVSTVGFEEVRQLSQEGMIFTSFLIIVSFGLFAYFITSTTKFMMDGEFRQYLKRRKMEKDLKNLKEHVIVCGFGRNGKQAAVELLLHHEKIVVIESVPSFKILCSIQLQVYKGHTHTTLLFNSTSTSTLLTAHNSQVPQKTTNLSVSFLQ